MSECESARNAAVIDLHQATGLGAFGEHFTSCVDCRTFLVRTRRMSLAVKTEDLSSAEVLRLRVRLGPSIPGFGSSRPKARGALALRPALVLGLLLCSGIAAAAAGGGGARFLEAVGLSSAAAPQEPPQTARVHSSAARGRAGAVSAPLPKPTPAAELEPLAIPIEALALEPAPAASQSTDAARAAERNAEPQRKPEGKWADVASSLRARDYESANRSLGELAQSSDPATRDTARLSLAQLWLQQGKSAAARELLRELSSSGATPFIRRRASELLR